MTFDTSKWEEISFGEIARSLTNAVKNPLSENLGRYVGLEHIEPGNIHIKSWGNVADGTTFTRVFRKGQVLFGKRRAYQKKAAVAEFDGVCSGDILVLESIEEKMSPELLPFIVQSDRFFDCAVKTSAGSLSPRTKFKDLAKFTFKLPPLDEQKRIADLLWSIDTAIESKNRLIKEMSNFLIIFINQFFLKNKHSRDWEERCLGDCLIEKPNYGASASAKTYTVGLPRYIRITDIDDKGILNKNDIVSADLKNYEAYVLRDNDFLFARTGNTVGKSYLYRQKDGFSIYAGYLIRFRLNPSILSPEFLQIFTTSSLFSEFKRNTIKVGAQPNINSEEYQKMRIPVPPLSEQEKIVNRVRVIKEMINKIKENTWTLRKTNQLIINQTFG